MREIVTWLSSTITYKLAVYITGVFRVYMGEVASL